jgi:hypothetical protein
MLKYNMEWNINVLILIVSVWGSCSTHSNFATNPVSRSEWEKYQPYQVMAILISVDCWKSIEHYVIPNYLREPRGILVKQCIDRHEHICGPLWHRYSATVNQVMIKSFLHFCLLNKLISELIIRRIFEDIHKIHSTIIT